MTRITLTIEDEQLRMKFISPWRSRNEEVPVPIEMQKMIYRGVYGPTIVGRATKRDRLRVVSDIADRIRAESRKGLAGIEGKHWELVTGIPAGGPAQGSAQGAHESAQGTFGRFRLQPNPGQHEQTHDPRPRQAQSASSRPAPYVPVPQGSRRGTQPSQANPSNSQRRDQPPPPQAGSFQSYPTQGPYGTPSQAYLGHHGLPNVAAGYHSVPQPPPTRPSASSYRPSASTQQQQASASNYPQSTDIPSSGERRRVRPHTPDDDACASGREFPPHYAMDYCLKGRISTEPPLPHPDWNSTDIPGPPPGKEWFKFQGSGPRSDDRHNR